MLEFMSRIVKVRLRRSGCGVYAFLSKLEIAQICFFCR